MFRQAEASDLPDIEAVQQSAGFNDWSAEKIKPYIESQQAFVWFEHNAVIAFALFAHVLDEVELLNIAVQKERQGEGVGLQLLQTCLHCYQRLGVIRCLLEVGENNLQAQRLYHKLGFVKDGVRKNYYQHQQGTENAVLMSVSFKGVV